MSDSVQNQRDEPAFYVYCIAESKAVAQLPADSLPAAIEDDARLEWVTVKTLAALVSRVSRGTYSEDSLAEHLTDATWTAIRAMRHETVVEYVAKRTSAIPLRFGTIYLERNVSSRCSAAKRGTRRDYRAICAAAKSGASMFTWTAPC